MTKRIALLLTCTLLLGTTGCSMFTSPEPEDAFNAFADALHRKDSSAAAKDTTDAGASEPAIKSMFDGMGKNATLDVKSTAGDGDNKSTAKLAYTWSFGPGREFRYDTTAIATKVGEDWRIRWAPALLHPKLRQGGTFQFSEDKALLTPVVDRNGQPLLNWQTVGVITLSRDHLDSAAALAPVVARFDDTITAESIAGEFNGNQDDRVTVIKLRETDLAQVADELTQIAGVTVTKQGALLTADPNLHSPAISGLPDVWQKAIDATAGWSVDLVDEQGRPTDELANNAPADTKPVRTTLDPRLQLLAQHAVSTEPRPTVLVAIAPSTGAILAAAQNDAANAQGPIAFTGLYPPGSTFKTITTAAALEKGLAKADTPEPCPGTVTIENRTIPNEDKFDLGTVPLAEAFAHSCNTTMGALADKLPADALPNTAKNLGIGVDFVIPGITTVTGKVPNADTPAQRVENGIGQGTVTVSPFGLAVAEASLTHGSTITPTLLPGQQTTASAPSTPIDQPTADALRAMMRLTVTEGTATALKDVDGLGGKTGTAEFGDNTHSHGWFAGIVGDLAFATLVVGGDSSAPAVAVSGDFLRPALAG
ncbi:penicillin-binding transpeptidase domain-containing protein [Mycolicibacterium sp. CBMA 226]|uniref:penicillin-binding transpeptidase domain-containing protein n=1 Tax=Mycolicibacterium sp. CBMA 226 TaxID=2606611 RepID=UPI0012DD9612|nr:penicillin-binding transpeptidase domain-containing protein [Mycolicibacterium sp. CBMA 226]MUL74484.1 penicillin-binding protein [Mycolicibacterium sp. CBMA 226]